MIKKFWYIIFSRKQQIFDQVATHLAQQKRQAIGYTPLIERPYNEVCLYRNAEGLKCAAGCLIPDSEYQITMEGKKLHDVAFFKKNFNKSERNLIVDLQNMHDRHEPALWAQAFKQIAETHELKFNEYDWVKEFQGA